MATGTINGKQLTQRIKRQERQAPLVIAGLDAGQSTTLLSVVGGETVQILSYVGTGDLDDLLATRMGSGGEAALRDGEIAMEFGGVTYFIGDLALSQSPDATTQRGDVNRYRNGHTLKLLIASVAQLYPDEPAIRLRLFTGLPIKVYRDQPELRKAVRASLEGTHFATIHDACGTREIQVVVECAGVVMEGVAAATAFGTPGAPMLLIDIGGGSYDAAYLNAAGEVVDAKSGSLLNNGSERIGEVVSAWFRQQHGRALSPEEVAAVLGGYLARRPVTVYEQGAQVIGLDVIERAVRQVTATGDSFLSQKLGAKPGSDAAQALVIGGAARFIRPTLYCPVTTPEQPERTNVLAYAHYAAAAEKAQAWPIQKVA